MEKDFETYYHYYRKNYSRFLPAGKNTRILDLGCGMGHFLYYLYKDGYKNCLGLDISNENINYCRTKGFNVVHNNIFNFLESNTEPFDVIIMNDVIEHLNREEIMRVLDLINKNLTEGGGTVVIKAPNSSNPILANSTRYYDFTHEISFTEESLSQVLKVCGFKYIKIYPQNIYIYYLNPINYIAKFISMMLNSSFRLIYILYGRKTTKIFTKDIIAVAKK